MMFEMDEEYDRGMKGRRGGLRRRQYLRDGMIRPFDGRYGCVLVHIGRRLYGLPQERAARIAFGFVMQEMVSRQRCGHNYPLVLLRNGAIAYRNERGFPPPTFDHDLTLTVAYASALALLKPRYRQAIRRLMLGGECCHTISPRFGWTREYFHEVINRFHQRVIEAYHVLKGDSMEQMLEGLRASRRRRVGEHRVTCLACEKESWLDPELGQALACECGSELVLIDGVTPAEWNRMRVN
jgi:hypothetical protein